MYSCWMKQIMAWAIVYDVTVLVILLHNLIYYYFYTVVMQRFVSLISHFVNHTCCMVCYKHGILSFFNIYSQQLGMYLENITIECNFQEHLPTTKTNYMPFQTWLRQKSNVPTQRIGTLIYIGQNVNGLFHSMNYQTCDYPFLKV